MRRALGLLTVICALLPTAAAAQTCPPSDPLCGNGKSPPKKSASPIESPKPSESPSPSPASDSPAAAPAPATPAPAPPEKTKSQRGVITLAEVTITGRIQKPIAAVDVSRIAPKLTLAELRQPFLDLIEAVIFKDPF
jgi:hypothetical protein